MSTSKTWPGGATTVTPTAYSIPASGEFNWASLSNFLNALGDGAQATTFQKFAVRKCTTSPVTVVASSDCAIVTDLAVAGAVTVNLPAGANKQVYFIADGKGDATSNNITINRNGSDTIAGGTSVTLTQNREGIILVYNSTDTDWKILGRTVGSTALVNPMDSAGDMIYGGASGVVTKLDAGTSGMFLLSGGAGAPTWSNIMDSAGDMIYGGASGIPTKLDSGTSGMFLLSGGAGAPTWTNIMDSAGDMIYGGASGIPTKLDSGTTGMFLLSGGAGAPTWSNIMDSAGDMIYGGASGVPTKLDSGTSGQWLVSGGAGAPSWTSTVTTGKVIDGTADENQLRVQAHSTQTSDIFVIEQSDGDDLFTISNAAGAVTVGLSGGAGAHAFNGERITLAKALANLEGVFFTARSTGTVRVIEAGVYKHAAITNGCAYLYQQQDDAGDSYIWVDDTMVYRISATQADIGTTGGTVIGTQTSDLRLKENVEAYGDGLKLVEAISPITFTLKKDKSKQKKTGFNAQELRSLGLTAVYEGGTSLETGERALQLDSSQLIPVLVNAIKELSARVNALESK